MVLYFASSQGGEADQRVRNTNAPQQDLICQLFPEILDEAAFLGTLSELP